MYYSTKKNTINFNIYVILKNFTTSMTEKFFFFSFIFLLFLIWQVFEGVSTSRLIICIFSFYFFYVIKLLIWNATKTEIQKKVLINEKVLIFFLAISLFETPWPLESLKTKFHDVPVTCLLILWLPHFFYN